MLATPVVIDSCTGLLYPGTVGAPVLVCSAHGYDELCTRATVRHLSEQLASQGRTVLRFDYPGQGDSADPGAEVDIVACAVAATRGATAWLRRVTGQRRVAIVAVRLGCPIALSVAEGDADIVQLALLAPVWSGRSYVREIKMFANVAAENGGYRDTGLPPGALNHNGFVYSAEMLASISAVSVRDRTLSAPDVLVLSNDDAAPLREAASRSGPSRIEHQAFPELGDMLRDPMASTIPVAALSTTLEWLGRSSDGAVVCQRVEPHWRLDGAHYRETAHRFGPAGALFGVLCEPRSSEPPRACCVLLNAGANYHIGWGRLHVQLARRLAAENIASLRIDFSGFGESGSALVDADKETYSVKNINEATQAVEFVASRGYEAIALAGNCSGAYSALRGAFKDERVSAAVMSNLYTFYWKPGVALSEGSPKAKEIATYTRMARNKDAWKRLLAGRVDLKTILRGGIEEISRRLADLAARTVGVGSTAREARMAREIVASMSARGMRIAFLFTRGDASLTNFERVMGPGGAWLQNVERAEFAVLDNADHDLSVGETRDRYFDQIVASLSRPQQGRPEQTRAEARSASPV